MESVAQSPKHLPSVRYGKADASLSLGMTPDDS